MRGKLLDPQGPIQTISAMRLPRRDHGYCSPFIRRFAPPTTPHASRVSSGRQAAVILPATRYRPESLPLEPGNGPQEEAIWDGF